MKCFRPLALLLLAAVPSPGTSPYTPVPRQEPEPIQVLPDTPQLNTGLGYGGTGLIVALNAFYGQLYRFAPGQEAARDAFHRLVVEKSFTAGKTLPPEVRQKRERCDAPAIRLAEEGVWLAHFGDWVVAPASGRFRFVAEGDARVTVRFRRQVVLDAGQSTPFTVTEGHSYPVEVVISGGQSCRLLIENADDKTQRDLFSCDMAATAGTDAPVWLLERYISATRHREPVRE